MANDQNTERVTPQVLQRHEEDTEAEAVRGLRAPHEPSEAEVEAYYASGHAKYRAWCRFCVGGRGRADPHRSHDEEECKMPLVSCDYCFMGEKVEDDKLSSKCLPI